MEDIDYNPICRNCSCKIKNEENRQCANCGEMHNIVDVLIFHCPSFYERLSKVIKKIES